MNMWGLLMIILAVLSAAGILYLASRIGRFWIIKKNNVHVMEDNVELIDNRFYIIGRADKSEEYGAGRKNMEELVKDLDPDKFSIVLDHQPEDYASQADSGVDLVLSGHTHGGQLFPLMTVEKLTGMTPDDRIYGYEKRDSTNFIVTSGILSLIHI